MKFEKYFFLLFFAFVAFSFGQGVCVSGNYKCDGNSIWQCINNNWVELLPCGLLSCQCTDALNCDCIPSIRCNAGTQMCSLNKRFSLVCVGNAFTINQVCPQNNCKCANNVCSCDQQVCSPGAIRCKVEGTNQIQRCAQDGSRWVDDFCPNANEVCENNQCVVKPPTCVDGEFKCSDTFESVLRCENNQWVEYDYCIGDNLVCDQATLSCNCPPNAPISTNPVCDGVDYIKYCIFSNVIGERGEWIRQGCTGGTCKNGKCVCTPGYTYCKDNDWIYVCNPNTGNFDLQKCPQGTQCFQNRCLECYPSGISWCSPGSDVLLKCENEKVVSYPCPQGSTCVQLDPDNAICQSLIQGGGGQQGGATGGGGAASSPSTSGGSSSGSYSGGGEVRQGKCSGWSDWFINKTEEKTDPTSPSIVCVNTTYIRWCKNSKGELDLSIYELKTDYKCAAKTSTEEICNYQSAGVYDEVEILGTDCRTCSRETLIYTCYPSGKQDPTKKKISSTCGLWRACTEEELQKYGKKPISLEQPSSSNPSMLDIINKGFEQYGGLLLTIVVLVIVGFGVYLFWRFYSEAKKPPKEEGV